MIKNIQHLKQGVNRPITENVGEILDVQRILEKWNHI